MTRAALGLGLILGLGGLLGCAPVAVTGTLGGEAFSAAGTVVAWLDKTSYVNDDNGVATLTDRSSDTARLSLRFYEAVFDPHTDFAALSASERERIATDIERGDALTVDVVRGRSLREDDQPKTVSPIGALPPEVLPYLDNLRVRSGVGVLSETATYPSSARVVGERQTATLTIEQLTPTLRGTLDVDVKRGPDDPDSAATGQLQFKFETELAKERIAECNLAPDRAGDVDACTLAPRAP